MYIYIYTAMPLYCYTDDILLYDYIYLYMYTVIPNILLYYYIYPAKTQKTENSDLHGFELHRPSSKGTKSLLQVIKAIINRIFTDILRPTCCCTELSGLVCDHGTILLRFVFAFAYTHTHVYVDVHVCVCIRTCVCAHLCVYILEQIELPTTLLDYFLWSNKSNINQNVLTHMNCIHSD